MRYRIINGMVQESFWIDAPYDTLQDAREALKSGVKHNCEHCDSGTWKECPRQHMDALQSYNTLRHKQNKLIGE